MAKICDDELYSWAKDKPFVHYQMKSVQILMTFGVRLWARFLLSRV